MSEAEENDVQKSVPQKAPNSRANGRGEDVRKSVEHREAMERVRKLGEKYSKSLAKLAE